MPLDAAKAQLSVPSKLYNFMAAGRPILGLAEAGSEVATLLAARECGVAVPPGDPAAIAAAVRALARSGDARRAYASNARAYVVEYFAKARVLGAYDALFERMTA